MTPRPNTGVLDANGQAPVTGPNEASESRLETERRTSALDNEFRDNEARKGDLIGYARVSTAEQSLALQIDGLEKAGCIRVFSEHASGAKADRVELARALDHLRAGDTLVVYKLDRLGRSLPHLLDTVRALEERGIGFASLSEQLNTTTPGGRLIFHVIASLCEFERDLIRERTLAGLAAARARGRVGGRPTVMTAEKTRAARQLYDAGHHNVSEIAKTLSVSRASIYRSLAAGG